MVEYFESLQDWTEGNVFVPLALFKLLEKNVERIPVMVGGEENSWMEVSWPKIFEYLNYLVRHNAVFGESSEITSENESDTEIAVKVFNEANEEIQEDLNRIAEYEMEEEALQRQIMTEDANYNWEGEEDDEDTEREDCIQSRYIRTESSDRTYKFTDGVVETQD